MMRGCAVVVMVAFSVVATRASAEDHVVSSRAAHQELVAAEAQRSRDVAVIRQALTTPAAQTAARSLSTDAGALSAMVATLSADELRDLASRAEALNADPVAGMTAKDTVWVILIVIAVLVVLGLLAAAAD